MARNSTPLKVVEKATDKNKSAALDAALSQIDRAFGKNSVMKLGDKSAMDVEAISTGSIGLDVALGIGGLPKGRVIEIYGPESSGKTTLTLHAIAECQKAGGVALSKSQTRWCVLVRLIFWLSIQLRRSRRVQN